MEVLRGAGITKGEAEEILRSGELYGNALNIVNEYIRRHE